AHVGAASGAGSASAPPAASAAESAASTAVLASGVAFGSDEPPPPEQATNTMTSEPHERRITTILSRADGRVGALIHAEPCMYTGMGSGMTCMTCSDSRRSA